MTAATANGRPPATSPVGGLPATWEERAAKLADLIAAVADAKMQAVILHAKAYLDGDGPGVQREQEGKLAAAEANGKHGHLQAELEAYRLLLDVARAVEWGHDGRP